MSSEEPVFVTEIIEGLSALEDKAIKLQDRVIGLERELTEARKLVWMLLGDQELTVIQAKMSDHKAWAGRDFEKLPIEGTDDFYIRRVPSSTPRPQGDN